ncbi:hypothetical protein [Dyadobacter sandarakinus]|uniref:Dolichyl-phosphate-mannose-protein mannosyltransferase n=1 Tax=Dyadobacter sandarakinus TaxID=2747268 RepID=A0ABX7I5J1_9BACT|nr:hypothetical protein [Dyadobacter sandarakinus]QRR01139.1 hypothetical protein HWI92_09595 [Dyadobacter sandarakinus]
MHHDRRSVFASVTVRAVVPAFLVVVAVRLYFIEVFAVPLPFWDQWDAEGDFLLRPWIQGTLRIQDLWQSHNEHRILPTRLLSLFTFMITGSWNNLTEARFNTLLAGLVPALIVGLLVRCRAVHGLRWLVVPVAVAQFALPFSFENFLVGFQSQFYFLLIFTVAGLALATLHPQKWWSVVGIIILSTLSILTMASGLLTPLAVAALYVVRMLHDRQISRRHISVAVMLMLLAVMGYGIIPNIPENQGYRAATSGEFLTALGVILSWPVTDHALVWILLWLPGMLAVPLLLWTRRMSAADMLMAGCLIWSLAQALAIAYGRGHWLSEVSSRYTELFSPGLIANAWFAVRLADHWESLPLRWVGLVFFVPYTIGHVVRYEADMKDMRKVHRYSLIQQRNVSRYFQTGDPGVLDQPQYEIPYPHADRLQHLLDDPTLRSILPAEQEAQ